jgi:hypothetical protein
MELKTALARVSAAIGSGKIIPVHSYVLLRDGALYATDGSMIAAAPIDWTGDPICVRGDILARALDRENPRVTTSGGDLIVRYAPRGRVTLRGLDPASFPQVVEFDGHTGVERPEELVNVLSRIKRFTGEADSPAWTTAVYFRPEFSFAVSNRMAARDDTPLGVVHPFVLPPWAATFILSQPGIPASIKVGEQMLRVRWDDDVVLYSTKIADSVSNAALDLINGLSADNAPEIVPGLGDAVAHAADYGATYVTVGENGVRYSHDTMVFEETIDYAGEPRRWGVASLALALEYATHLDLTGTNGVWRGTTMRGTFAGMV